VKQINFSELHIVKLVPISFSTNWYRCIAEWSRVHLDSCWHTLPEHIMGRAFRAKSICFGNIIYSLTFCKFII